MSVSVRAGHLFDYAGAGEPVHGYIRSIVYVDYIAGRERWRRDRVCRGRPVP
jgi:hypothetical protein